MILLYAGIFTLKKKIIIGVLLDNIEENILKSLWPILNSSREGGFPNACVTHWYTSPEIGLSNLHSQHWRRKSVRLYVTKFKKRCIFNCDRICWSQTEFFVCFCWTCWYGKILFVSLSTDFLFCHKTWWAIQKSLLHVLLRNNHFSWEYILVQQKQKYWTFFSIVIIFNYYILIIMTRLFNVFDAGQWSVLEMTWDQCWPTCHFYPIDFLKKLLNYLHVPL